ncbi:hypothetical protein ACHAQJ_003132 [Trichoderma viride]
MPVQQRITGFFGGQAGPASTAPAKKKKKSASNGHVAAAHERISRWFQPLDDQSGSTAGPQEVGTGGNAIDRTMGGRETGTFFPSQMTEASKRTLRSRRVITDSGNGSSTASPAPQSANVSKRALRPRKVVPNSENESTPSSFKLPSKKMESVKKAVQSKEVIDSFKSESGDEAPTDGILISPVSDAKTPAKKAGYQDSITPSPATASKPRRTRRSAAIAASASIKRSFEDLGQSLEDVAQALKKARKEISIAASSSQVTQGSPADYEYGEAAAVQSGDHSDVDWPAEYKPQRLIRGKARQSSSATVSELPLHAAECIESDNDAQSEDDGIVDMLPWHLSEDEESESDTEGDGIKMVNALIDDDEYIPFEESAEIDDDDISLDGEASEGDTDVERESSEPPLKRRRTKGAKFNAVE